MMNSIQVAIKFRPLIRREKDENLQIQWTVVGNALVPIDPEKKRGEAIFHFDHIFTPEKTNKDVFKTVVKPIVNAAVNGFNGTVFAYGQTSSGKTYTMLGTDNEPGIISLAVEHIFDCISESAEREFLLRVSYLEIYNEKVLDLFDTSGFALQVCEDSNGLAQFLECKEEVANSPDIIMNIVEKGDKNRKINETDINGKSSRSHTIFRITIESRNITTDSDEDIQVSQLNLVDLAGSERVIERNATGEESKEGIHINMSLSTLGLVIKQLSNLSDNKNVNFQDSKLTKILKGSLGGNAMTSIICTVTPAAFEETQYTLSFASRAKSIKNKPIVNKVTSDTVLLKRYKNQLSKLNDELVSLKNFNRISEGEEMGSKLQETDQKYQLLEDRIMLLKRSIVSSDSRKKEMNNFIISRPIKRRTWAGSRAQKLNSRFSLEAKHLPTIKEMCTSPESKSNTKSRNMIQNIIQNVNLNNESFQTAFMDFELELIESEKERESWSKILTPKKQRSITNQSGDQIQGATNSPGTPKSVLRERLSYVTEEFQSLQEFTTLERQTHSEQLTDEYKECLKELEQVKSQNELLFQENKELKSNLVNESNKLKSTNILVKALTTDTDCLMEKLIKKNSELTKLKEKVDVLEKVQVNKKPNIQNTDAEIKKLNKIIVEQAFEIAKHKQLEEAIKLQNDRLQQSLDVYLKAENLKSQECKIDRAQDENSDISNLSEIIRNQTSSITSYQQLETNLQPKVEQLQQCLDAVTKVEKSSQKCQTDVTNDKHNIILVEQNKEISRLTNVIEEKILDISKFKQHEEQMKQEIERLQNYDVTLQVETKSKECQTSYFDDIVERIKVQICAEKDFEISRLEGVIKEITLELTNYMKFEEDANKEMERLKSRIGNVADNSSEQSQVEDIPEIIGIDRTNEVSGLLELIRSKSSEIERYRQSENEMKMKITELQQHLENLTKVERISVEFQKKYLDGISAETNSNIPNIEEVSSQNSIIQDAAHEIEDLNGDEKDMKIIEQLKIIDEKTLNIAEYQRTGSTLRNEIERLNRVHNELKFDQTIIVESSPAENICNGDKADIQEDLLKEVSVEAILELDTKETRTLEGVLVDETKVSTLMSKADKSLVELQDKNVELESSSIFANLSYFDNMEVSHSSIQESSSIFTEVDESKNNSSMSANSDTSLASHNTTVIDTTVLHENIEITSKSEDIQSVSFTENIETIKIYLEKENARLSDELEKKVRETEEVQRVVTDFKQTLVELQQTIHILTNENMDLSKQLTAVRENNSVVVSDFQREIDSLTNRLLAITEEKIALKSELVLLSEQYENVRSITPVITDEEIKHKISDYQVKVKALTDENIELSTNLYEKIDELEKIKENKIQLYDHECTYKERAEAFIEKIDRLEKENIELSNDLMEQIEEYDKLKDTVNVMKEQLEVYTVQKSSISTGDNDLEFLKQENIRLTSELIELRAKLTQLTRENINLSNNLVLDSTDESDDFATSACEKKSTALSITVESSINEVHTNDVQNISAMNKKVKLLQEQVKHLTMLNKKLGELKLTNCSQCAHLKELNDSRRELKLEVKSLNQKLADLQKKFKQKCADTEALRTKANEDFNASLSMLDSTLDGTLDGINVTVIEEKVQNLHSELEELRENHNKLSNQYKEKCNELEKLQYDNTLSSPFERKDTKRSKTDSSSRKNSTRIQNLQKDLDKLSYDLQELKKINSNTSITLNKFMIERNETMKEIESLKLSNEELTKECYVAQTSALHHEEKVKLLEEELSALYKQIEAANASEKEYQSQKLEFEVQLESLLKEKADHANSIHEAKELLNKELKESHDRLLKSDKENNNLKNEIQKLEDLVHQLRLKHETAFEEKRKEEIESAKSRIMKEIKSLKSLSEADQKDLPKKSVTDIFVSFLNTILSKEQEIIKGLQEEFEKKMNKIEEETQQSVDIEKRASLWAKTLETDLEKLQGDLTEQEYENKRLQSKIHRMEENLKEAFYENQQLHSRISNLETDINSLQNELDKKLLSNNQRNSAISVAQEKERQAKTRENEWEDRLMQEREKHVKEIQVYRSQSEQYQSANDDLKSTLEVLDLEVEHLKNTINIKADDLAASLRKIDDLQKELEHVEDTHHHLKIENMEKDKRIEDITHLLKMKCDLLTEYKTKVETMKPEYDSLLAQITERKVANEKYKDEIHALQLNNKMQLDILQDKLNDTNIKSDGLNNQIVDLKNKNTDLYSTIIEMKDKCAELEKENANLQRKVRNSTSKVRVENDMQELQDENKSLKNQLEGSYNRIKELQESKCQIQRELIEVQGNCELLEQELNTVKNAHEFLEKKYNDANLQELRKKYGLLLSERNNILRELEDKKMLIANKDQKLVEYSIQMDTLLTQREELHSKLKNIKQDNSSLERQITNLLGNVEKLESSKLRYDVEKDETYKLLNEETKEISLQLLNSRQEIVDLLTKNKELDEEMDDLVGHIHKQESEIAELQDKLITRSYGGQEKIDKMKDLENENEKIKIDLRVAESNCSKLQTEIIRLNSEKEQLNSRIDDLNNKIGELETKNLSRCSSKSNSPTTQKGRRRHRRSDLYNQNRNLESGNDSKDITDTDSLSGTPTPPIIKPIDEECHMCAELRNRIREMSLDVVSRNNKITILELQLEAENFPYQMKCNEMQEKLLQDRTKNHELKLEVQKLQRALMKDSSRECQVCRQKKLGKTEQAIQVNMDNKSSMLGIFTGCTEDQMRLEKIERDKNLMKNLCRSRARTIKELEERIRELEGVKTR